MKASLGSKVNPNISPPGCGTTKGRGECRRREKGDRINIPVVIGETVFFPRSTENCQILNWRSRI